MTVYVDDYRGRFRRMVMCHMKSDTSVEELHRFAQMIGLRRSWFQDKRAPHYDVCLSKRKQALKMGAVHLPIRLPDGSFNPKWREVHHKAKQLKKEEMNVSKERPRDLAGAAYEGEASRRAADRVAAYLGYAAEDLDAFRDETEPNKIGFWAYADIHGGQSDFMHWWWHGKKGSTACRSHSKVHKKTEHVQHLPHGFHRCSDCHDKYLRVCSAIADKQESFRGARAQ